MTFRVKKTIPLALKIGSVMALLGWALELANGDPTQMMLNDPVKFFVGTVVFGILWIEAFVADKRLFVEIEADQIVIPKSLWSVR